VVVVVETVAVVAADTNKSVQIYYWT